MLHLWSSNRLYDVQLLEIGFCNHGIKFNLEGNTTTTTDDVALLFSLLAIRILFTHRQTYTRMKWMNAIKKIENDDEHQLKSSHIQQFTTFLHSFECVWVHKDSPLWWVVAWNNNWIGKLPQTNKRRNENAWGCIQYSLFYYFKDIFVDFVKWNHIEAFWCRYFLRGFR